MATVPSFDPAFVRKLAEVIVEAVSHRQLSEILADLGIEECGGTPRWQRIQIALLERQKVDGCGNHVAAFIIGVMKPVRFSGEADRHEALRLRLNQLLLLVGLSLRTDGQLEHVKTAASVDEAQERAKAILHELARRRVHPAVIAACQSELKKDNYFHAVLEATKSAAQKIRERTGLVGDGSPLADAAFGLKAPRLALNSLTTETEQMEQSGFLNLLKGIFGVFRNPTAHDLKTLRRVEEQDALDLLTMLSYVHRRLDSAALVPSGVSR